MSQAIRTSRDFKEKKVKAKEGNVKMKILLFSDSHGYLNNMIKAVETNKETEMIIHLGDCVRDAINIKKLFPAKKYEYVRGNNDWSADCPEEKLLYLGGKKIFITHGHRYGVKLDYIRLILQGKAVEADAVFFGHTHCAEELYEEGIMMVNPGSIGAPSSVGSPTYCVVEISDGEIISRFHSLG